MQITITIEDQKFSCDLSNPLDISIPLNHQSGVVAFGADMYSATPYQAGSFVGSIEAGSPVNFYNLFINPHGNGTHTETVRHIDNRGKSIYETIKQSHFIARLITITPRVLENGDMVILEKYFEELTNRLDGVDALVIRTLPNTSEKLNKNYTGTNPCYIDSKFIAALNKTTVKHLLFDMPSVDREVDDACLSAHKEFWKIDGEIAFDKTITEMIYVDNTIEDGLYLLNTQTISVDIDASPSRPVLYALNKV